MAGRSNGEEVRAAGTSQQTPLGVEKFGLDITLATQLQGVADRAHGPTDLGFGGALDTHRLERTQKFWKFPVVSR